MPVTKYGKYITREIIKQSKYSQITTPIAKYDGDRGGDDFKFEWSCITKPFTMDNEPEVNNCDQYMLFASSNTEDFSDFQAEIELPLGPEGKKQIITQPKLVYIPRGLKHGPVKFKSIKKHIAFMNIFLSPQVSTDWVAPDESKYIAKLGPLSTPVARPGTAPSIQASHPTGTPFRHIREVPMPALELFSEKLGFPGKLCMGYFIVKYREFAYLEPVHYHTFIHQRHIYLGSNPTDIEDFDADIELWLGKEREKHVIDTCAVNHMVPGLVHLGDEIRRVGKPFLSIGVMVGTGEYFKTKDKVLLSREDRGEVMISEGSPDYVPPTRED
jgi:hypothetical protein